NSGGPLLNINGELIGINTAIARQAQGIGFAIPIDTAKRIARDLIEFGQRRHPYLGVFSETVGQAFSKTFGGRGVLVADVKNGSPAQVAGLEVADVLLSLDGHILTSPVDLYALLATCTPQNKVRLGLLRGTKELDLEVVLDELPADAGSWHALKAFGFQVDEDPAGLVIVHVEAGSAAERTGLRPGDRVAEVAGRRVASQVEFSRHIISLRGQAQTKFLIVRGNRGYYIELP
ncbi:MAG: PDZ domain-containing protein, partial [Desulfuromonadales bacterium]|nr:PDZ domain-containing protein [Desulfuromonadales bacterium]